MALRLAIMIPLAVVHSVIHRLEACVAGDELILSGQPFL